jgi:hypothetical protein
MICAAPIDRCVTCPIMRIDRTGQGTVDRLGQLASLVAGFKSRLIILKIAELASA